MISRRNVSASKGFTLIETLVVVTMLGLLATVVGAAFVVIIRTSPVNEARTDDSRALLSLTNLLSQDVASTEETGFVVGDIDGNPAIDSAPTLCDPGTVPASQGLIQLRWDNLVANYRWVPTAPGKGQIVRFSCVVGGPAERNLLTTELLEAPSAPGTLAPAPVVINLKPTTNGNPGHSGVEFLLFAYDADGSQRELLRLDASTRNVRTTLPPGGGSGGPANNFNTPPSAQDRLVEIEKSQTLVIAPIQITDPENDTLEVSNFDTSAIPNNWTTPTLTFTTNPAECPSLPAGCWKFAVTAHNSASTGAEYVIPYRVCDRASGDLARECSPFHEITLRVVDVAATPPSAAPFTIDVVAGSPVSNVLLPISDAAGLSGLTVTFTGVPNGWTPTATYTAVSGVTGWFMSFPTNPADVSGTFQYTVNDGVDTSPPATITVNLTAAPTDNPPAAGPVSALVDATVLATVPLSVTDESVPTLVYEFQGVPAGWTAVGDPSAQMTLTTDAAALGTYSFTYRVRDAAGQYNPEGWAAITVEVSNAAPIASPLSTNGTKTASLPLTLPVYDAEETLVPEQISWLLPAGGWSGAVTQSGSSLTATITPPSSAAGPYVIPYTVTDSAGQSASSNITISVCSVTSVTFNPQPNTVASSKHLGSAQDVTIATNGFCGSLVARFNPKKSVASNANPTSCVPAEMESKWETAPFNATTTITIGTNTYSWDRPTPASTSGYFCFVIRQGASGPNEYSGFLRVTQ